MIESVAGAGAGAASTGAVAEPKNPGGSLGQDEFLTLLVAQLKNQDPMNPLNAEQFAAQLAQFSSLEQLIKINETLEGQTDGTAALMDAMNATTALSVVGRDVLAAGSALDITEGGAGPLVVGVGGEASSGTLKILDDDGEEVASMELGALESGPTGNRDRPGHLGPGARTLQLHRGAHGRDGDGTGIQTFSRVHIDGVRYGPGGPVLISGDLEIPLSNVVEVLSSAD